MTAQSADSGAPARRVRFIFAWYDLWVGAFYDKAKRRLYVLPLPCVGVIIQLGRARHIDGSGVIS